MKKQNFVYSYCLKIKHISNPNVKPVKYKTGIFIARQKFDAYIWWCWWDDSYHCKKINPISQNGFKRYKKNQIILLHCKKIKEDLDSDSRTTFCLIYFFKLWLYRYIITLVNIPMYLSYSTSNQCLYGWLKSGWNM